MNPISASLFWEDVVRSETARRKGIPNTLTDTAKIALPHTCAMFEKILEILGSGVRVKINSVYRAPAVNKSVGGSKTSQHMLGEAIDFQVEGCSLKQAFDRIRQSDLAFDQLLFEFGTWLHISFSKKRTRRSVMVVESVSGKTKYMQPFWTPTAYPNVGGKAKIIRLDDPADEKHAQVSRRAARVATPVQDGNPNQIKPKVPLRAKTADDLESVAGSPDLALKGLGALKGRLKLIGGALLTGLASVWEAMKSIHWTHIVLVLMLIAMAYLLWELYKLKKTEQMKD